MSEGDSTLKDTASIGGVEWGFLFFSLLGEEPIAAALMLDTLRLGESQTCTQDQKREKMK